MRFSILSDSERVPVSMKGGIVLSASDRTIVQIGTSKHSGAISLFDREFVKTGIFPKEFSRTLHLAFDRRKMHDYGEVTELDAEMVDFTIEDATIFVTGIDSHLRQDGHL